MIATFDTYIAYGQLLVFLRTLARPGLIKDDEHIAQGFAWAPGIVSFSIPDHDGFCRVSVDLADRVLVDAEALWALSVPFDVSATPVEIGTVASMHSIAVPRGAYRLVFQVLPRPSDYQAVPEADGYTEELAFLLQLTFCPPGDPDFAILKRGSRIKTDRVLTKTAEYA